jgi:hypothetical protein
MIRWLTFLPRDKNIRTVRPVPRPPLPSAALSLQTAPDSEEPGRRPLRRDPATGPTPSVLVVSHHLNGFLRTWSVALLHATTDHGVRRVSSFPTFASRRWRKLLPTTQTLRSISLISSGHRVTTLSCLPVVTARLRDLHRPSQWDDRSADSCSAPSRLVPHRGRMNPVNDPIQFRPPSSAGSLLIATLIRPGSDSRHIEKLPFDHLSNHPEVTLPSTAQCCFQSFDRPSST